MEKKLEILEKNYKFKELEINESLSNLATGRGITKQSN